MRKKVPETGSQERCKVHDIYTPETERTMRKLTMEELNRTDVAGFREMTKIPLLIVLDNIRSQQNIGSVFRTADAFRLEGICLCGISATPPHREIHRSALGATESVHWEYFETTPEACIALKERGFLLFGVEQTDESNFLHEFEPPPGRKMALVFGNEVNGIEDAVLPLLDGCLEIPQFGTKHSLNISVSVGIVVWDIVEKMFQKDETLRDGLRRIF
jgi:23S rRNA (guanosine2251-2'-O)-methyltransferase